MKLRNRPSMWLTNPGNLQKKLFSCSAIRQSETAWLYKGGASLRSISIGRAAPGSWSRCVWTLPVKRGEMFSVALVGPDGAGKTTLCRRLEESFPIPVKYIYMGVSSEASNLMLPTTRLLRGLKRKLGVNQEQAGPPDL